TPARRRPERWLLPHVVRELSGDQQLAGQPVRLRSLLCDGAARHASAEWRWYSGLRELRRKAIRIWRLTAGDRRCRNVRTADRDIQRTRPLDQCEIRGARPRLREI